MAKKSKLDAYLASTRTAPLTQGRDRATGRDLSCSNTLAPPRVDAPIVSDAAAAAAADAAIGPVVDSPTSRAYAEPVRSGAVIQVRGVGPIAVLRRDDGSIDRAVIAFSGVEVAKYRRTSAHNPAMRWWPDSALGATERSRLLDALANAKGREILRDAPAAPTVVAPAPVDAPSQPTAANAPTEAPAKRERSTDPGVSFVLTIVAEHARYGASGALESAVLDGLRAGTVQAIAAWSASAWLEGRAVTLFGGEHERAMAARDALRSAVATFLRASADEPARGVPVDLVMGAIGA